MLSAIVLTKNEEDNISDCLQSLNWCSDLIVVDDNSSDKTREIAKERGAKVYIRNLDNDFAAQRNFGLKEAKGEWVLFVDADERVTEVLASEIKSQTSTFRNSVQEGKSNFAGYYIKRYDVIWGRKLLHGETGDTKLLRLAKKNAGEWRRNVHEVWKVKGKTGILNSPLLHFPHQTIEEFVFSVDYYSTLDAEYKKGHGVKSNVFKILFWPLGKFIYNWIIKKGFLDGVPGLLVSIIMSMHSYLSWSKLWILQKK